MSPLVLLADSLQNRQRAQCGGLRLPFVTVVLQAKIRHYLSVLYHLAAFCSRYYLLPSLAVIGLMPWLGTALLVGHIAVRFVQFSFKKPSLDPITFLFSPLIPRLCPYSSINV
jgi:hypothetical protein